MSMNKVIWKDGMFIYPQHFQQQDLYHTESLVNYHMLQPFHNWGILELEIDESYLNFNKIVLKKAIGVFPDGTYFDILSNIPKAIDIPKDYTNKFIYIGVAIQDNYTSARYDNSEKEVPDIYSNLDEVSNVTIGKLNINIFLETQQLNNIISIPVIKIIDANERVNIDKNYIYPSLRCSSSHILNSYINR